MKLTYWDIQLFDGMLRWHPELIAEIVGWDVSKILELRERRLGPQSKAWLKKEASIETWLKKEVEFAESLYKYLRGSGSEMSERREYDISGDEL